MPTVGTFQAQGRQRQIIVKLLRFKDKQSILSATKKHRDSNIHLNKDFSDSIKRRELMPQLRVGRERGDFASFRYDKLLIKPRNQMLTS